MTVSLPADVLDGIEQDSGAEPEAVMKWLETGEGNPWHES